MRLLRPRHLTLSVLLQSRQVAVVTQLQLQLFHHADAVPLLPLQLFRHADAALMLVVVDRLDTYDRSWIGSSNDGCNPPCPQEQPACGFNAPAEAPYIVEAAPCSSCNTCGGGEVIYSDAVPVGGCANGTCGSTPIYGEGVILPGAAAATAISVDSDDSNASEGSGSRVDPVVPDSTDGTLQGVQEEVERRDVTQPSVSDEENDPIVDPGAFVPRATNTIGG